MMRTHIHLGTKPRSPQGKPLNFRVMTWFSLGVALKHIIMVKVRVNLQRMNASQCNVLLSVQNKFLYANCMLRAITISLCALLCVFLQPSLLEITYVSTVNVCSLCCSKNNGLSLRSQSLHDHDLFA